MYRVVLDTNILLSALWSRDENSANILDMIISDNILLCYDYSIMKEYKEILNRPKFAFNKPDINEIITKIKNDGLSVLVKTSNNPSFTDERDRKFYDVAKSCDAYLITGNKKHFPRESFIIPVKKFLNMINQI